MDGQANGEMDGQTNGHIDRQMYGQTDGWTDEQTLPPLY